MHSSEPVTDRPRAPTRTFWIVCVGIVVLPIALVLAFHFLRFPVLVRLLLVENEKVSNWAAETLVKSGPAAVPYLLWPSLRTVNQPPRRARGAIDTILGRLSPCSERNMASLLAGLRLTNPQARWQVVASLTPEQCDQPRVVEALIEAARSDDPLVRYFSIERLGQSYLLWDFDAVISALSRALEDREPTVQHAAAHGLTYSRADIRMALPGLTRLLKSDLRLLRQDAIIVFGFYRQAAVTVVPELVDRLPQEDAETQIEIIRTLVRVFHGAMATTCCPRAFSSSRRFDPVAERALDHLYPALRKSIPTLIKCLRDPDGSVRYWAADVLAEMGAEARDAIPALSDILKSGPPFRCKVVWAIHHAGTADRRAIRAICDAMDVNDEQMTLTCVSALPFTPCHREAVPALVEGLKDDDVRVRRISAYALGRHGRRARHAIPALQEALRTSDEGVRLAALESLRRIGGRGMIPLFIETLHDSSPQVRRYSADLLGEFGSNACTALPALAELLQDPANLVQVAAIKAIGQIAPDSEASTQALATVFSDAGAPVRCSAVEDIFRITNRAKALEWLSRAAAGPEPEVRASALRGLSRIVSDTPEAADLALRGMADTDSSVRRAAMEALAAAGAVLVRVEDGTDACQGSDGLSPSADAAKVTRAVAARLEERIPALMDILQATDTDLRHAAAGALGNIGWTGVAVPVLVRGLDDVDVSVQRACATALGKTAGRMKSMWLRTLPSGPSPGAQERIQMAVRALIDLLQHPRTQLRAAAAQALGEAGDPVALPALIPRLVDRSAAVRQETILALRRIGLADSIPELLTVLKHDCTAGPSILFFPPTPYGSEACAELLRELGAQAKPAIPLLLRALRDENPVRRRNAAYMLGAILEPAENRPPGPPGTFEGREGTVTLTLTSLQEDAREILLALMEAFDDSNAGVRQAAANALAAIAPPETAVPVLIHGLEDADSDVRVSCAEGLGLHADKARDATPALLRALRSPDPETRASAAAALEYIVSDGRCVADLLGRLNDPAPRVRAACAKSLGRLGQYARPAIPTLQRCLPDVDKRVGHAAAQALGRIARTEADALKTLVEGTRHKSWFVRANCARALGGHSFDDPVVLHALIDALRDDDQDVRTAASDALTPPPALSGPVVLAPLLSGLRDPDPLVRTVCAQAVGMMRPWASAALPTLAELLKDEDDEVREAAAEGIRSVGATPELLPTLIAGMSDADELVRSACAEALGNLGGCAAEAIPVLTTAAEKDEHREVRTAAAGALRRIRGQ